MVASSALVRLVEIRKNVINKIKLMNKSSKESGSNEPNDQALPHLGAGVSVETEGDIKI